MEDIFAEFLIFLVNSNSSEFKFLIFKLVFYFLPPESCFWHFPEKSDFSGHFFSFFSGIFLVDLAGEKLFFSLFIFYPFSPPIPPCFSFFFLIIFLILRRFKRRRARARARDLRSEN